MDHKRQHLVDYMYHVYKLQEALEHVFRLNTSDHQGILDRMMNPPCCTDLKGNSKRKKHIGLFKYHHNHESQEMMDALEGNTSVEKHLKQTLFKSTRQTCSIKKVLLNFSQDTKGNTCVEVSFLIKFMKKETPTHMFSGEF